MPILEPAMSRDPRRPSLLLVVIAAACGLVGCDTNTADDEDDEDGDNDIVRVDKTASGNANGEAQSIRLSSDGRYAVFASTATNLAAGATSGVSQIYRKDLTTGTVILVSKAWGSTGVAGDAGSSAPSISDDGSVVVFASAATNLISGEVGSTTNIFHVDLIGASIGRVPIATPPGQPNAAGQNPLVSGNGQVVVFASAATNLVASDANGVSDVFAYKRSGTNAGTTRRVSLTSAGAEAGAASSMPTVNQDGTSIAFQSSAGLVAGDTNGFEDIYLATVDWGVVGNPVITRISNASGGGNPDAGSQAPSINTDGSIVAFASTATNLVASDTNAVADIFVYDRSLLTTYRISVSESEAQAGAASSAPSISGSGRYVAFASTATNLVTADTNAVNDVFVRDRTGGHTTRLSTDATGTQSTELSTAPAISRDGAMIGFEAQGTTLPGGETGKNHVYRVSNTLSSSG
jgi:hypothetical protein